MICVGYTVQSDNNALKDTEGKTLVSVSQNSEESTQESRNGKTDGATASNGENKREETTSSPKETPVIPIP